MKRSFPQGQNRRSNTEHKGRDIEPESLAFIYKNTVACIHLQRSLSPRWKKRSHCMDNKTMSQFCSTKDLQALVAIITVWQWEFHHQTPIIGSHCFVYSTFECRQFPTIDLCKINPFHLRKKKLWVTSCYEVAIYILPLRWSFFLSLFSEQTFIFFSPLI